MIPMNNVAQKLDAEAANSSYSLATEGIRAEATRLLASGAVAAVVGYRAGRRPGTAQPLVVTTAEQTKELIFSPACLNNLALYLTRSKREISRLGRLAVVAKGCDQRAIAGLVNPMAGEIVKAFVSLKPGFEASEALRKELIGHARKRLGAAVAPKELDFRTSLPRTRSGKIMRRLLKARELGLPEGDLSTLENDER